jgi:hypothetical protein
MWRPRQHDDDAPAGHLPNMPRGRSVSAGESSSRGPLKVTAAGVTRAALPYFVGALQYVIDERGVISVDDWNEAIDTARDLATRTPNDGV